jgi:hypothetical protein
LREPARRFRTPAEYAPLVETACKQRQQMVRQTD